MRAFGLALQLFRRDWRNQELRLLALALVVAVSAVTAVSFFTSRIERAMQNQAGEVLAADLQLTSGKPLPARFRQQAIQQGLQTSELIQFHSVVLRGDRTQMVEVKAVDRNYPLRGRLYTRDTAEAAEQISNQPPAAGSLWADNRLLLRLQLQPGERLSIGDRELPLSKIISRDPTAATRFFSLGPNLLMALEDLPSTGLVTPASRVTYQLLVAGDSDRVDRYRSWATTDLPGSISLNHMSNARPELRNSLDRAASFLGLAALLAVLMASAAVALASRRFVERQADTSAILRCLGASRRMILWLLLFRLLLLALLASLLGALIGYLAQQGLAVLVSDWFSNPLPRPGLQPLAIGIGVGLITLFGFTLPPVLRLADVSPLRVLRRDLPTPPASAWLLGFSALGAIALLMWWQAGDLKLAAMVLGGTLATLALLLLSARALVALLAPLRHRSSTIWRYGLAGLARNPMLTALQMSGFGLAILSLLLLAIVRVDLLNSWQLRIPPNTPNLFLINIQPQQTASLAQFLEQRGITGSPIYPMLRGRLERINGNPVSVDDYRDQEARRLAGREFNLSWARQMPADNQLLAGRWWPPEGEVPAQLSIEQEIAEKLRIKLGDRLTFEIAGRQIEAPVTSLRAVQWDSFQPNFYVIAPPGLVQGMPTTYITSIYLPPQRDALLSELIRQFPAITTIDVTAIMEQIRGIISRGSLAVEYVFLFSLVAGLLVLYAGIQASREHRRQESAILRTLGLKRIKLLQACGIEFFTLGLLAGLLATASANLVGWLLATELFGLQYHFNPQLWLIGVLGGGIGIGLAGISASYPLLIQPPLQTLRSA